MEPEYCYYFLRSFFPFSFLFLLPMHVLIGLAVEVTNFIALLVAVGIVETRVVCIDMLHIVQIIMDNVKTARINIMVVIVLVDIVIAILNIVLVDVQMEIVTLAAIQDG